MFKRRVESHQEEAFDSMEAARSFAEKMGKSERPLVYRGFLKELKTLGVTGRYLEVGAGPGVLASIIAQEDPDVQITALEISPNMASVGEEYVSSKGCGDRIQYVVGDAVDEALLGGLGKFDLVYCTMTLHHFEDPEKIILNLMSVLKDGGMLFLYDLRRAWWLYWVPSDGGFFRSIRAAYVESEIREMFQRMGVSLYKYEKVFPFLHTIVAVAKNPA